MPCAPATIFDLREQLCVWDMASGAMGGQMPPGAIPPPGYFGGPSSGSSVPFGYGMPSNNAGSGMSGGGGWPQQPSSNVQPSSFGNQIGYPFAPSQPISPSSG